MAISDALDPARKAARDAEKAEFRRRFPGIAEVVDAARAAGFTIAKVHGYNEAGEKFGSPEDFDFAVETAGWPELEQALVLQRAHLATLKRERPV